MDITWNVAPMKFGVYKISLIASLLLVRKSITVLFSSRRNHCTGIYFLEQSCKGASESWARSPWLISRFLRFRQSQVRTMNALQYAKMLLKMIYLQNKPNDTCQGYRKEGADKQLTISVSSRHSLLTVKVLPYWIVVQAKRWSVIAILI